MQVDLRPSRRCGRVQCEPSWNWAFRQPDFDIWLAVSGRGTMGINGTPHPIQPGTLFVLRPGDDVWAVQDPEDRLTVAYLHFDFCAPGVARVIHPDPEWLPSRHIRFSDVSVIDRLLTRAIRSTLSEDPTASVEARAFLNLALVEIYRQDAAQQGVASKRLDPRVDEIIQYLRAHPSERVTTEEMARRVGLSSDYFSRLFRSETGESFRSFVKQVRLERARFLLEETAMKVGEIADSLGYQDVYLFSRQFREAFGYPPSGVRRRLVDL